MKHTFLILFFTFCAAPVLANNLHVVQTNPQNGFTLFRTGEPSKKDIKELCDLGVTEMMVLSGDAEKHELKYQSICPTLKVVYNEQQDENVPVTRSFLESFDQWIQESQALGKKIAFRCKCGCHRTGRLAAYYQMKYQGLTPGDALILMKEHGKFMVFFPSLKPQVRAMYDFIQNKPCSTKEKYCVKEG